VLQGLLEVVPLQVTTIQIQYNTNTTGHLLMLSTAEEILKKPRYRRKENLDEWKSF
jgi:hypothetical protein